VVGHSPPFRLAHLVFRLARLVFRLAHLVSFEQVELGCRRRSTPVRVTGGAPGRVSVWAVGTVDPVWQVFRLCLRFRAAVA
jgi:hypothetical protein